MALSSRPCSKRRVHLRNPQMPVNTLEFNQIFILARPGRFTGIPLHSHFFQQSNPSGGEFILDITLIENPAPKAVVGLTKLGDSLAGTHRFGQFVVTSEPNRIGRLKIEAQSNQGKKTVSGKLAPVFPLIDNPTGKVGIGLVG